MQLEAVNAEIARRERLKVRPSIERGPDAETVKAQVDITVVIERYVVLHKAGRTWRGKCPVHDGVSDSSLAVYPESQSFFCFGCGIGGDCFDFLMWAAGCESFPAAIELACLEAGIPAPKIAPKMIPALRESGIGNHFVLRGGRIVPR
jgi:DNA primase